MNAHELQVLSRLFSYPDTPPDPHDLPGLGNNWSRGRGNRKLRNLQAEYVRLFINALPEVPCPPYGSFYLEGTLMGESTVKIRNLYLSYGIEPTEMADHATAELEFLAAIDRRADDDAAPTSAQAGDKAARLQGAAGRDPPRLLPIRS